MTFLKTLLQKTMNDLPEWLRKGGTFSEQIREMRELLGMTQEQLSKRANLNPRHIRSLESSKNVSDPQLSTLMKVAEGLGCELLLRFIPKKPTRKLMEERARKKARQLVQLAKGSSAMEEQQPLDIFTEMQINELANKLLQRPSQIWEDE